MYPFEFPDYCRLVESCTKLNMIDLYAFIGKQYSQYGK